VDATKDVTEAVEPESPETESAPCSSHCYAYCESNGTIDIDTISDTPDNVRIKYLEMCMDWRFGHPDRYNQDEEWQRLLQYGNVVPVSVSLRDA